MRGSLLLFVGPWLVACDASPIAPFDIREMQAWRICTDPRGADVEVRITDDPAHCGGCDRACGEGVRCVDGRCVLDRRLHCGAAGRACVGFAGADDVECVAVDARGVSPGGRVYPNRGPTVGGHACVPAVAPDADSRAGPVRGAPPHDPEWVVIPGPPPCPADGSARCGALEVQVRDICGERCTAPIGHDFEIMTTEMSRATYRDRVLGCGCAGGDPPPCAALCADDGAAEARPITGLSWCAAYDACRAIGGRLPTAVERARVEAVADVARRRFEQRLGCGEWFDATGAVPWVAECFARVDGLALDRVDGDAGAVLIGSDVLPAPRRLHHLLGNAGEWLAEPADEATCAALSRPGGWGPDADGWQRPRVARGLGLFRPAGEPGDRLRALDPGDRAAELGVRCARTVGDRASPPMPYDSRLDARAHALCVESPLGHHPVREAVGQWVQRAVEICLDRPEAATGTIPDRFADWLAGLAGERVALARQRLGNDAPWVYLGVALFAPDAEWWLHPPARAPGESLGTPYGDAPIELRWAGAHPDWGPACAGRMQPDDSPTRIDGPMVLGERFVIDREALRRLTPGGTADEAARLGCGLLECAERSAPDGPCEARCTAWHLPLVIDFRRVGPPGSRRLCPLGSAR